jgi:Mg2+-importing ATPase
MPQSVASDSDGTRASDARSSAGLTGEEAARRAERYGRNEPLVRPAESWIRRIRGRFANPLVAILILSSAISAALGDVVNATIVLSIVAVSIAVELVQTGRSERAAKSLASQVAQTASVLRDGKWQELRRSDVVPGDVVRVSAGDMVPADAELLDAKDLHLNEAALTGESMPVEKERGACISMGSSVVSGLGTAQVTAIGGATAFGAIARSLAERPPPSEFELGMVRFGVFISKTVAFLLLFLLMVGAALHRDPLQTLLFGVALAVGLTPEFLPMITTVTLTKGAVRMANAKVIVKKLAAIQNFGSMDVLCSDKTGTLTTGVMTLERSVDSFGKDSERPLLFGCVNSYFESGVDNPVDAALLGRAKPDALDSAVLRHEHPDISGFCKVDEMPFDFERRRVTVVASRGKETLLVTKGAPEHVLDVCTAYDCGSGLLPLTDDVRASVRKAYEQLGREGYRVLAVAHASVESKPPGAFSKSDERDLVLDGFLAFVDPPRPDAGALLANLASASVKLKVLTGDSELVTRHVCERVGMHDVRMLLGADVEKMSDPALAHAVEEAQVFARVSPSQKNRILMALKTRGHVVGFLGDGINDAPSLHAADVGISVSSAVDVAKDAADVILLEPGLDVLHGGIIEGRKAYGNVMKYLLMGTSSNFGNMFSMALASVLIPFLPMLPTQILLNNFLYDCSQITIPSDDVDDEFVRKPRRWDIGLIRRFMLFIGPVSSVYDFLTFFVLLHVFHASQESFRTGWFIESLATQTLVIFVIRTARNPFRSRPSRALVTTTLAVVAVGVLIPFFPFGKLVGFVPPPAAYLGFVAVATATYLLVVEFVKRRVLGAALT